jgi:hypothetical protein
LGRSGSHSFGLLLPFFDWFHGVTQQVGANSLVLFIFDTSRIIARGISVTTKPRNPRNAKDLDHISSSTASMQHEEPWARKVSQ